MHSFNIVADIEDDAGEDVDDERETDGKKRGVNEKKANFTDRNIKPAAKVGAYPEGMAFKKG